MMKRLLALIVALVGITCLVFGIIFVTQATSAKQKLIDDISPLQLSQVNARYDTVKAYQTAMMLSEETKVQTGQDPSPKYDYFLAQRALLGLAKSNNGLSGFVLNNGIVDIVLGFGLVVAGLAFLRK